jgi:adenine-specific DNA-methyltransferase
MITYTLPRGTANALRSNMNDGYLVACFEGVNDQMVKAIAQAKPYYAVFRDSSFSSDSTLVNFEQKFKTYSPSTIRKVL